MKFLSYPLLPFSFLYDGIMRTRNWLYDHKILPSRQFRVPTIVVGNLTVGGTGKTPHVEYLVRLLQTRQLAILSRGYRRRTKGFVLADERATAATVGDEPYQYHQAFPGVRVAVCEDRVAGIEQLLQLDPAPQIILLDDALQHRPVRASLNILITDYHRLFYRDFPFPAGRLREGRSGANRADVVVVSKCPEDLPRADQAAIAQAISPYLRSGVPIFFSTYQYQPPVAFGAAGESSRQVVLVTGIAQTRPLVNYLLQQGYEVLRHFNFPDHHAYTQADLAEISNFARANPGCSLLTTQKDWTKLAAPELQQWVKALPFFYLPIRVSFLADQVAFDELILKTAVKDSIDTN